MSFRKIVSLAVLTAIVLSACGGSSKPSGAAALGSQTKSFTVADVYKYSSCMRKHGVTNFPDPLAHGTQLQIRIDPAITGSPAYETAYTTCAYLVPAGAGRSPTQQRARAQGLLA